MSLPPPRCFTCGKPMLYYDRFNKLLEKNILPEKALDQLGLSRLCCRRMVISQYDNIDKLIEYSLPKEPIRRKYIKEDEDGENFK